MRRVNRSNAAAQRRPVAAAGSVLFVAGINDSQFNIQVRAREYYSFFGTTLLACGVVFQVPVGVLA